MAVQDRADIVHEAFRSRLQAADWPDGPEALGALTPAEATAIFRAQCLSRHLDRTARHMQAAGRGFYTIGSSGHEGMAAVAAALRPDDMAFLHYRDGAFQTMRASQLPGSTPVRDMLLSFAAAAADPISGGRHKVLGSKALCIPPQTSTIASHLPKAMGAAYSIGLAARQRPEFATLRADGIVACSFGDASVNHSTAQGALNAAGWAAYQAVPMPILWICEDNGIGISVRTPKGWIAANFASRPELRYFAANGLEMAGTYRTAKQAADYVRRHRKPAILHLSMVRLYGHAGSDVQEAYLPRDVFEAWEADDPLLYSAALLVRAGVMSAGTVLSVYDAAGQDCARIATEAGAAPRLSSASEVMASLLPPARHPRPTAEPSAAARTACFGAEQNAMDQPQPMARLISWALTDLMLEHHEIVCMGQDVARKGGVYGVTRKLVDRFGARRVIDTLLDEQSILGLAIGMAHNGFIPIPEIQFLAYLHNAEDQIRGEAATLSFFSNGQFTNPMVVRIAGLGYQRGFGGHFHNDNSLAVLRDVPGLVLAVPSDGADAVRMLRECVRLAREEQRVVVFVEPIALYSMRDLHAKADDGWMRVYPARGDRLAYGEVGVTGEGGFAILTYGNGHYLSRQAAARLAAEGIATRVIDIRWIAPLPEAGILAALEGAEKILIVDECRRSGNVAEALLALVAERKGMTAARHTAEDSFIATGPAHAATLPSADSIVAAARALWSSRGREAGAGP